MSVVLVTIWALRFGFIRIGREDASDFDLKYGFASWLFILEAK